ncbi:hypothetical protein V8E52_007551 [Russula decolorans]|jgi:hypothetical protein
MGSNNHYRDGQGQTWTNSSHPSATGRTATNDIPAPSHPLPSQQHGAFTPQQQPRGADTVNSATHGQIHPLSQFPPTPLTHPKPSHTHPAASATSHDHHVRPPVVSPTVPRPTESLPHSGLEQRSPASDHPPWVPVGDVQVGSAGHFPPSSSGQPHIYNNMPSSGRRPTNNPPDAGAASPKKCRIPDCTYNAYYDFSEQVQTEYCGQGHELQAVATGLVASCAMCKCRPRRTGERVCGHTCRERERQARQVQGSYYSVPVVRRESRTR